MDIIKLKDKNFKKYISAEEIDMAISKVAQQINEEYKDDIPIFIITLNGAIIFAADLFKRLTITCSLTCVKFSSYEGTQTTNDIQSLIGLKEDLRGKRVIIVEDIVDTGNTYEHLMEILKDKGTKDIKIATMTFKPDAYKKGFPVHYVGLTIPPKFVVGRGLDYDGLGRNLNDIYQVCE